MAVKHAISMLSTEALGNAQANAVTLRSSSRQPLELAHLWRLRGACHAGRANLASIASRETSHVLLRMLCHVVRAAQRIASPSLGACGVPLIAT